MSRHDEKGGSPPANEAINPILERAKAEWEAAFDSISEGIAIVDLDGTVRRVNRALASLLGRDVRNMVNVPCCDIFTHHRAQVDACPVRNFPEGSQGNFEVFFPDYRYYEDSCHPIIRNGTMQGLVVVVKDVTREQITNQEKHRLSIQMEEAGRERREAQETLDSVRSELTTVEKTAAVGRLAGQIFHEVNRSLSLITQSLEGLHAGAPDDTALAELVTASKRCARMLDTLSQVRVDDEGSVTDIHYHILLDEVAENLHGEQVAKDVRIDLNLTKLPPGEGNPAQLRAVFASLMLNALQATPQAAGPVVVSLRRDGDLARIEVRDRGAGIAPTDLPHIFNPFFTTDPQSHRVGLGLTICQSIIQGHQGFIEIDSEPGKGTIVSVLLPVSDGE